MEWEEKHVVIVVEEMKWRGSEERKTGMVALVDDGMLMVVKW